MPRGHYGKRNWTPREDEFMHDNAGKLSNAEMAKKLGRSEEAVQLRRCREGMPTMHENIISYTLLSDMLGVTRRVLRKWVERGWLKGTRATWKALYGKYPMLFEEDDILEFMRAHPDRFPNPRKIPDPFYRRFMERLQATERLQEAPRHDSGAWMPQGSMLPLAKQSEAVYG